MDQNASTPTPSDGPRMRATPCSSEQTQLGEGARWDARRQELVRVDILAGRVFRDEIATDGTLVARAEYVLPEAVGAVAPIEGDDGWLVAAGRGLLLLREDGSRRAIATVAAPGSRMNDGAADPQGRFWVGTLADDHRPGAGTLFRLGRDGRVEAMLDGLTISNGLGWSPDGSVMYLVDSGPRRLYAFDFDSDRGTISRQRTLVELPEDLGAPDGMTVDAAGDLWVAVYGGAQVRRYGPSGALVDVIQIPAQQVTSCAFGGPAMDVLFVTTATEGWTPEQRHVDPAAGIVYRLDSESTGVPAASFRPEPGWWPRVAPGPSPRSPRMGR